MIKMFHNGKSIEGHPIGLDKIILGDVRRKEWTSEGETHEIQNGNGTILYDRSETQHRPWFILVYESGRRCVD